MTNEPNTAASNPPPDLRLLISVFRREQAEEYVKFFRRHGINAVFATPCNGTATRKMLDYLGVENTEKLLLQAIVARPLVKNVMSELVSVMGIGVAGNGIAMTVPIGSVGGSTCLRYLTEGQSPDIKEVNNMSGFERVDNPYALIMIIAEKGSTDTVMEAARSAGARGGTVVHAKGTGTEFTAKFFGVSIAAEKEIIYIVAKKSDKSNIMKAIMNGAGVNSDAHAVVFALPVDNVTGFQELESES